MLDTHEVAGSIPAPPTTLSMAAVYILQSGASGKFYGSVEDLPTRFAGHSADRRYTLGLVDFGVVYHERYATPQYVLKWTNLRLGRGVLSLRIQKRSILN